MAILYRQVYESLRDAIRRGEYSIDERLPSEAELSSSFSVSAITIKHALDLLRKDGYILRRPRLGTIVISADPSPASEQDVEGAPLIGLVVPSFDDTFGTRVIEGILDAADTGAHVIVKRSRGSVTGEDESIRALVEAGVTGLVLLPSSSQFIPPAALELVMRQFPVVILDRSYDGIPVSAVLSDNSDAAKAATEHLFGLGLDRVGFAATAGTASTTEERRNGYIHAHAARHIPLEPARELLTLESTLPGSDVPPEDDISRLMDWLSSDRRMNAFLVTEYAIAVMLREACRRLGMSVPEDASIICFDHPTAPFDRGLFRYTHVEQNQRALGGRAIEQVLAQIGDRTSIEKSVVRSTLVIGDSTREQAEPAATA